MINVTTSQVTTTERATAFAVAARLVLIQAEHSLPSPRTLHVNGDNGIITIHLASQADFFAWVDTVGIDRNRVHRFDQEASDERTAYTAYTAWIHKDFHGWSLDVECREDRALAETLPAETLAVLAEVAA